MSTALAVTEETAPARQASRAAVAFEPQDITECINMAEWLFKSGLLSKGITKPEAAFAIIVAGRELGFTAMQSLRSISLIEGKIALSADAQLALIVGKRGLCEYFECAETTDAVATYKTKRVGTQKEQQLSFTIEEATKAGLTNKDVWKKYGKAMLRARCISALARIVYPDLLSGVYDPDELSRGDEPKQDNRRPLRTAPAAAEVVDVVEAPTSEDGGIAAEVVRQKLIAATDAADVPAIVADISALKLKVGTREHGLMTAAYEEACKRLGVDARRKSAKAKDIEKAEVA